MSLFVAARISGVEPRKFVAPRTFAGRKKSCIRQIDVGTLREQHVDARHAVLARGVEQRREAAAVEALRPALGRDVALIVASRGTGVDVGAMRDQELDHRRMPARRRPHQRGLPAEALRSVAGRAALEQQLRGFDVAGARDGHQRRHAVRVRRIGVRARVEQQLQDLGVRDLGRQAHRRGAVIVRERHVGTGFDQPPNLGDVVVVHGPLQRRAAVRLARVDVGPGVSLDVGLAVLGAADALDDPEPKQRDRG